MKILQVVPQSDLVLGAAVDEVEDPRAVRAADRRRSSMERTGDLGSKTAV
jgi:hypothetical protein